jgi:hypothetical protein
MKTKLYILAGLVCVRAVFAAEPPFCEQARLYHESAGSQTLLILQDGKVAHESSSAEPDNGNRLFFGFNRSKPEDPVPMQQRGYDAVQEVSARLESAGFELHLLQSPVPDTAESKTSTAPVVTRNMVHDRLQTWSETLQPNDTIIIYSHTHGLQNKNERPGGLLLGRAHPAERGILSWAEYAEQMLRLPAKNVVVLTMACHSGELTDWIKADPDMQALLRERRESGRNFLVLTSQNAQALSNPRPIEGRIINPFTYAVMKAFEGEADGHPSAERSNRPDGKITLGELAAFILDETAKHTRPADSKNDPDPQMAGAFDPETVLIKLNQEHPFSDTLK